MNVVGYLKRSLVFIGALLVMGAVFDVKQFFGTVITLIGITAYSIIQHIEEEQRKKHTSVPAV